MTVRDNAVTGIRYGILVGVHIHIAILGFIVFQMNQDWGMMILVLPVCFDIFWFLSGRKIKGPKTNQLYIGCALAIPILVFILTFNGLGLKIFGAVIGGAFFYSMPGMAIGAAVGAIRCRLARANDAPQENATLRVVIPLIISIVLWITGLHWFTRTQVRIKDSSGWTALHWTAMKDNRDSAEFLLALGADVNARDNWGATPLHRAVRPVGVNYNLAQVLITHGADVNAKDNDGDTALHIAAGDGYNDIAELLLANGADVNAINKNSQTPLDSTGVYNNTYMGKLLRQHGGHE